MANKLVLKVKISTKNLNAVVCHDGKNIWEAEYDEAFPQFQSLKKILLKGFTIRIDESDSKYNLIVSKKICSISFNASKEKGVIDVLTQAEEWAETMLKELNSRNTITGEGVSQLLETLDSIYEALD